MKRYNLQNDYDLLHYLVSLPFGVATPSAIASGIDAWSWVIAEKAEIEVALMSEILSAWSDTIRLHQGIFSKSLKFAGCFFISSYISDTFIPATTTRFITPSATVQLTKKP